MATHWKGLLHLPFPTQQLPHLFPQNHNHRKEHHKPDLDLDQQHIPTTGSHIRKVEQHCPLPPRRAQNHVTCLACWGFLISREQGFKKPSARPASPRHVPPPLLGSPAKGSI
eukprot:312252-Chlamydomonas_euryale.AAC.1